MEPVGRGNGKAKLLIINPGLEPLVTAAKCAAAATERNGEGGMDPVNGR